MSTFSCDMAQLSPKNKQIKHLLLNFTLKLVGLGQKNATSLGSGMWLCDKVHTLHAIDLRLIPGTIKKIFFTSWGEKLNVLTHKK